MILLCNKGYIILLYDTIMYFVTGSVSYKTPKFKVKNKISGKYMTAVDVDQDLTVEDASGDDSQLW